jgi:flagellar biogenesis protein FliO
VITVPGGKTLLVGVTPNHVNLIAELGEVELEQAATDGASFLDVLSSKLSR